MSLLFSFWLMSVFMAPSIMGRLEGRFEVNAAIVARFGVYRCRSGQFFTNLGFSLLFYCNPKFIDESSAKPATDAHQKESRSSAKGWGNLRR